MGCAAGSHLREDAGQPFSSGEKATAQGDAGFHEKYLLDGRIGRGTFGIVHAVSEKTQAVGICLGDKVRVQIVGSDQALYNGLSGQIVSERAQDNMWQVKLAVAGTAVFWWTKGENLIPQQASKAVKIIGLGDIAEGSDFEYCSHRVRSCRNEVSVWKMLRFHANIVRLHEVFYDEYLCYFVMERCHSSLFNYMVDLPVLTERSIGKLIVQMIHAINHLHSYRVVHRDVKPENFLMGGPDGRIVKLCDYGLSAVMPEEGQLKGVHGTAPYLCPEMLRLRLSDEKADVWSVGVVAYLLLCGKFPYQPCYEEWTGKKMKERIRDGGRPECERSWLSESAASMLRKLLNRKPVLRPSAKEALSLPFFQVTAIDINVFEDFPCLRPVLESAASYARCQKDLDKDCGLHEYLNLKQVECHGREIPASEPNYMPELPPLKGNWIEAQRIALSRAMARNVAAVFGTGMSTNSLDDDQLPSNVSKTLESNAGACGSICSTAMEHNEEVVFGMKVEM